MQQVAGYKQAAGHWEVDEDTRGDGKPPAKPLTPARGVRGALPVEQGIPFWVSKPSKSQSKPPLGHRPTPAFLIFWEGVPQGESPSPEPNQGQGI